MPRRHNTIVHALVVCNALAVETRQTPLISVSDFPEAGSCRAAYRSQNQELLCPVYAPQALKKYFICLMNGMLSNHPRSESARSYLDELVFWHVLRSVVRPAVSAEFGLTLNVG